jgi:hypothetical protein
MAAADIGFFPGKCGNFSEGPMKLSAFVGVASGVFAAMLATAAPNAARPALVDMTFDLDLNGMSSEPAQAAFAARLR